MKDNTLKDNPADVQTLLEALKNPSSAERFATAEELASYTESHRDSITAALVHPDWHVRWGAAHALGRAAIPGSMPSLRRLLKDSQPRVARTAAWALGRTRDATAVAALEDAVHSSNSALSAAAAWALGHIGTPEAIEVLSQALDAASPKALRSIGLAFAEIGPEAIQTLVNILQEGSVAERTRTAQILSRFGEHAIPLLLPLLKSSEVKHRRAAAHILGTLRLDSLRQNPAPETEAPEDSDDIREKLTKSLRSSLTDEDVRVRRNAARSAGVLGLRSLRLELEKLLNDDPDSARVAANALAEIGDPAAGDALNTLWQNRESLPVPLQTAVSRALEKLGLKEQERQEDSRSAPVSKQEIPSRSDFYAEVPAGLEAVAWEEIAGHLQGASLKKMEDGILIFQWKGNAQAGAILRSVRHLYQGGAIPKEIPLAKRLRRYRVRTLPASLDPTTAYCLARLANLGEQDVFVDLTCGSAAIAIERALDGPARMILAGDIDPGALQAARENILTGAQPVRLLRWDARQMPLADQSVHSVVANLPYGHRSGDHTENLALYPELVQEADRILKAGGLAVFLTTEKRLMREVLEKHPGLFLVSEREIEAGGLRPSVFVLQKE